TDAASARGGTARLLADLAARGALLGAAAPNGVETKPERAVPSPHGLRGARETTTMHGSDKEPHERS
ncbi:MAG TPA: hypothetical protein VLJ38_15170, partial [Polyangiaceae bacterium]|nr:hypothetical protein [Polyangiaceae bacterium]